jgi:glycosyltransferase involved in cell wall biosynthesis
MIARFDPWKGIDVALRAMIPLLSEDRNLFFLIVGGQYRHFHPEYGVELRRLVATAGLERQVLFAGYQLDVRPYLARFDLLLHASIRPEPFGLTILEAMAAEVPVVAARGGGAAEIVADGENGLTHPPGDAAALGATARRLLGDGALARRLAAAGAATVAQRFTPAGMIHRIEGVYDEVLGG